MAKINLGHRQLLESQGITVMDVPYDTYWKTDMFVRLPNGKTLATYVDWRSVPFDQLANGDEYAVAVSPDVDYPYSFNYNFDLRPVEGASLNPDEKKLFCADPFSCALFLAVALLVAIGLATCIMVISLAIHAPCGTEGKIQEISDCEKVITKPDCSSATFNQCYDENGDGIYEGRYTSDWSGGTDIIKWVVLGVAAVAGIYLVAKILPGLFQKKPQYAQYYQPQQYTRAPGIDYVY